MIKLNLLIGNPGGYLEGYVNCDPMAGTGDKTLLSDPSKLEYWEDGEVDEIRAFNLLSYFDAGRVEDIISVWAKKLAYDGFVTITDVDIVQAMKAFDRAEINFVELNHILYGEQDKPWRFRKVGLCMNEMAAALLANGLDIVEKRFESIFFQIKAVRKCK